MNVDVGIRAQGAHPWLEIYPCGARNATLAWLKKRNKQTNKQTKNMKNPVFHTLSRLPFYTYLLTLFIVPSISNGSHKHLYTLRIPESPSYEVLASLLFSLKYVCNGPVSNFSVDPYI